MKYKEIFDSRPETSEGHCRWERDYSMFKEVNDIVQPKNILEIGFNVGHSAVLWMATTEANVVSVDIGEHDNTKKASRILKNKFQDRFSFILSDSKEVLPQLRNLPNDFDLIFVDGGHNLFTFVNDLNIGFRMNCEYFLVDDYEQGFIKKVLEGYQTTSFLEKIKVWENRPKYVAEGHVSLVLFKNIGLDYE